jgi:hypothetical protein
MCHMCLSLPILGLSEVGCCCWSSSHQASQEVLPLEQSLPVARCFFFFFSTGVWTQGLHLEPLHQPFFVRVFWEMVSGTICPGWLWTMIFLISASQVARITGVSYRHPATMHLCKDPSFCPANLPTFTLLNSLAMWQFLSQDLLSRKARLR